MTKEEKLALCRGCRDDFYNGRKNCGGGTEFWSLETAKVVTRWRLGWWTSPVAPGAFTEVKTLSCYHVPGQFAFYAELPSHAVAPRRLTMVPA